LEYIKQLTTFENGNVKLRLMLELRNPSRLKF